MIFKNIYLMIYILMILVLYKFERVVFNKVDFLYYFLWIIWFYCFNIKYSVDYLFVKIIFVILNLSKVY